jgi:predicted nucleic acid-binding protein
MTRYVFDACALIAFFQNEKGADKIADVFEAAENGTAAITINVINLFEIYYDICRTSGEERAERVLAELKKRPIVIISEISEELFKEAGRFKLKYKMSLADSMALAQASLLHAELITSDHHELGSVEQNESVRFLWIR